MASVNQNIQWADIPDMRTNYELIVDKKGVIVYMNDSLRSYFQLPGDAGIGLSIRDLISKTERSVTAGIQSGKVKTARRLTEKKGRIVAYISPTVRQPEVVGAAGSLGEKDHETKQLSTQLDDYRRQIKLLESIFDISSDGLWIVDSNGTIVAWNPAAELITGIKADEVIGRRFTELNDIGIYEEDIQFISEAVETKRRVSTLQVHPKSQRLVLINATPVLDDDENLLWIVGNEIDLSELKAMREELENAIEVTQKAREELTGLNLAELRDQEIVVKSKEFLQVLRVAKKLAEIGASHILITGESGTGKGLLAKFIHKMGARSSQPFVQINCAAVPENLLEAELFGYEKGAFTGAGDRGKAGLIELADGGTLFLDEVGDMPPLLQAKLLKYFDDHEVMRLGSVKARKIDCSIVSATNQNLDQLVGQKRFRQDLFFRLNNFQIHIPPLRERNEDIFELVQFFIRKYNKKYKLRKRVSAQGIETLQSHPFPGNVRELRSLCEKATIMSEETLLDPYFAENLRSVCAPAGWATVNTHVRIDSAAASIPDRYVPAAREAAWYARNLNPQPPGGKAITGPRSEAAHPPIEPVIRKAIEMGRAVCTEICRELSTSRASRNLQSPPAPAPAETPAGDHKVTNLTVAMHAYERQLFLTAITRCRTIRELAAHLQTSPATALRKLKKHGLSLPV